MKKQIEEMAVENLVAFLWHNTNMYDEDLIFDVAEALCNAGYRKQSSTAKEIFAEVGKILTAKYNSIQAGCHHRMRFGNADTPQGMKELGELSGVRQVIAEIKAFEKKYLEDGNDS
jgi:hypothetical protein